MDAKRVFDIFKEISDVPRGSYHNEKISKYLTSWAESHDLAYDVDEALNVIIRKPGTKGYENSDPVIIQGHMDMVCEHEASVTHDFENEGLELFTDGDLIGAKGTTLGADDGIAIAMALAILESDEVNHPPIEAVFTTDEEVGMLGAAALDLSQIKGRRMINIDSEEEGTLLVSCAGGMTAKSSFSPTYEKVDGYQLTITVANLIGGHSGTEIGKNRTNASNLLARILFDLPQDKFRLSQFVGGNKDNVITSLASAVLVVDHPDDFMEVYDPIEAYIVDELAAKEPEMEISVEYRQMTEIPVVSKQDQNHLISFINQAPVGVQVMSATIENLIESSLNMGCALISEEKTEFGFSLRSQKSSYREYMFSKISRLSEVFGGKTEAFGQYPAWDFKDESPLLNTMKAAYEKLYGTTPVITGIHAGLECGIFYEGIENMDIISIGANTYDIHSPRERLSISSTERVFAFVLEVLSALK